MVVAAVAVCLKGPANITEKLKKKALPTFEKTKTALRKRGRKATLKKIKQGRFCRYEKKRGGTK